MLQVLHCLENKIAKNVLSQNQKLPCCWYRQKRRTPTPQLSFTCSCSHSSCSTRTTHFPGHTCPLPAHHHKCQSPSLDSFRNFPVKPGLAKTKSVMPNNAIKHCIFPRHTASNVCWNLSQSFSNMTANSAMVYFIRIKNMFQIRVLLKKG